MVLKLKPTWGWVIVTLVCAVQPFASVTVTEYVPATRFVGSSCVVLLLQAYVYGEVPPVVVRSIEPVLLPKHNTFTCVVLSASGA